MAGSLIRSASLVPVRGIVLFGLLATSLFSLQTSALNYVSGSKCEAVCADKYAGTVHDNVRCLDNEFDVAPALHLRDCVTCQLNSTAVDPVTKVTDVQWGLFNLRYILANCMFAYPEQRVSISSPCQVLCSPLQRAVIFGISNSTNATNYSGDLGFCTGGQFDDFTVNACAFCYSFIPQQLILGNFLQALHIACHTAPVVGKAFYPDGIAIFNQSAIPGPTGPDAPKSGGALSGTSLILAIVLPLIGGILILAGICCCCWRCSRQRRARMAHNHHMSRYHDGPVHGQMHGPVQDFSPMSPVPMTPRTSPPQPYVWTEPPREMESISVMPRTEKPRMIDTKVAEIVELPASKTSPGNVPPRWASHAREDSSTPLTSPVDNTSHAYGDDSTTVVSDLKESVVSGDQIGNEGRVSPPVGTFQAQDGSLKEKSEGGWTK